MMTAGVLVDEARLQELEHVEKMWLKACQVAHMHLHMFVVPGESFFEHGIPRVAGELAKSWAELSRLYTEGVKMAQETTKLVGDLNEARQKAESAWQSEHCLRLSKQSELDAACAELEGVRASLKRKIRHADEIQAEYDEVRARCEMLKQDLANVERMHAEQCRHGISLERRLLESRAEVGRCRLRTESDGYAWIPGDGSAESRISPVEAAYRRGAEAMRGACVACVANLSHEDGLGMGSQRIEGALRALPIPGDK